VKQNSSLLTGSTLTTLGWVNFETGVSLVSFGGDIRYL